jgi:D-glycero-D-manno-heptose 1,7-bisphosphate phosphatase
MDKKRTVFLDRDGTLCRDVGYPAHWSQVHVYPYAFKAVRRLREAGLAVVVITSQSGIGRGFFAEADLTALHHEFAAAFARRGAALDALYHCPHYTPGAGEGGCPCGKPNPGLALRAAADLDLELKESYVIGDKASDILFGVAIGALPVLVLTGYGRSARRDLERRGVRPAHVAADLAAAAGWIYDRERRASGCPGDAVSGSRTHR